MSVSVQIDVLLVANALWFGAGFVQFMLRSHAAAGLLTKAARGSADRAVVAGSIRFLGGLNLGFAALCVMVLLIGAKFADATVSGVLLMAFAIAHGSQFLVNLPIARVDRSGATPLWPVLTGPMLTIFVVDALLAALNLILSVERLLSGA